MYVYANNSKHIAAYGLRSSEHLYLLSVFIFFMSSFMRKIKKLQCISVMPLHDLQ